MASDQVPAKRLCIVGAGACGLATLKAFIDCPQTSTWDIVALEKQAEVGGVWVPSKTATPPDLPSTPIYDSLTTNLPHPIMRFTAHPFPAGTPLYPTHHIVRQYLSSYSEHFGLGKYIRFGHEIIRASWKDGKWSIRVRRIPREEQQSTSDKSYLETFDYLLLCSGHYNLPFIPQWPGISDWSSTKTHQLSHSIYYRSATPFKDKVVLVVGAGPSARDILAEVSVVAKKTYHSLPRSVYDAKQTENYSVRQKEVIIKPPIRQFTTTSIQFEDLTFSDDVDVVISGTGYRFDFPFFGDRTLPPLEHHMIPVKSDQADSPPPVLFLGTPSRVIPFPLFEFQALAATQILLGRKMPSAPPCTTHVLDLEQFNYCDTLARDAGVDLRVQPWVTRVYALKNVLRKIWRHLEREGDWKRWVEGVDGVEKWRETMDELIGWAIENGIVDSDETLT
ncbi:hypothetical protein DFJ77DRAFT_431526 [Powellomyces hirtus]|nr:hypothetical protein DFJ77DRAFT_431526 [Powellomyces hirtus]